MFGQPDPCIVIAGNGISASALAFLLRDSGFGVIMIAPRSRPRAHVVEALPQAAVHLLHEIGLSAALSTAEPVAVAGFDNRYHGHTRRLDGTWTHVDRTKLAHHCLRAAARRHGATMMPAPSGPAHADADDGGVAIGLGQTMLRAFALVDATGRAARWSRPVRRAAPATATLYAGGPQIRPRRGMIHRIDAGWVYRLDHPAATTIGVVSDSATARPEFDAQLGAAVGADRAGVVEVGVRSASVQWSVRPVRRRQLAIGDAALALNPLAGQGVRFALASATAAAAVLRTWADGGSDRLSSGYYQSLVDGVRTRHLAKLAEMRGDPGSAQPHPDAPIALDCPVRFSAPSMLAGQNCGGRIVARECFALADGGLVRSVAGIDLAWVRDAAATQPVVTDVAAALTARGVSEESARLVVGWAL